MCLLVKELVKRLVKRPRVNEVNVEPHRPVSVALGLHVKRKLA